MVWRLAAAVALAALRETDPDLEQVGGQLQRWREGQLVVQWSPALSAVVLRLSWGSLLCMLRILHLLPALSGLSQGRLRRILAALVMSDLAVLLSSMLAGQLKSWVSVMQTCPGHGGA